MTITLLWMLVVLLILVGLAGTVLPALPGTVLIFAAFLLGAWIDDFSRIGAATLIITGVLMVLSLVLDYVAGLLGARKAGASRQALTGAALGTVAGIFMGLFGVFFMPLIGAVIGEYLARQHSAQAGAQAIKVGIFTWLGIVAGLLSKVVIAFVMIGIFIIALWF